MGRSGPADYEWNLSANGRGRIIVVDYIRVRLGQH
jgi:hypothetical protein